MKLSVVLMIIADEFELESTKLLNPSSQCTAEKLATSEVLYRMSAAISNASKKLEKQGE